MTARTLDAICGVTTKFKTQGTKPFTQLLVIVRLADMLVR